MALAQLDPLDAGKGPFDPAKRFQGPAPVREHVPVGVRGDDHTRGAGREGLHDGLRRKGRVLIVVDEDVVEPGVAARRQ